VDTRPLNVNLCSLGAEMVVVAVAVAVAVAIAVAVGLNTECAGLLLYDSGGCCLRACSTFIGIVDFGGLYTVPVASEGRKNCEYGGDCDCDCGGDGDEVDSKNVRRLNFELSATSSCAGRNDIRTQPY